MSEPAAPPRWLQVLRVVLAIAAFGLLGIAATQMLAVLLFTGIEQGGPEFAAWSRDQAGGQLLLGGIAWAGGFFLATLIVGRLGLRLTWEDLRWRGTGKAVRASVLAFLVGGGMAALVLVAGWAFGSAHWLDDQGTLGQYLVRALVLLLFLLPAAAAEEITFRGVPLVALDRVAGRGVAIGATSLVFALAHGGNTGVSTLGIGNICLAGLLIGIAFYAPGGIWTATGWHLGWNWAIAALDAPVSGLDLRIPRIDYDPGGPLWLTGGVFGPEGGVLATLVLGIGMVLATRWILVRDHRHSEMHRPSNHGNS